MEDNVDRIKISAARKWVDAVNNWGKCGIWNYAVVKDLTRIEEVLNKFAAADVRSASHEEVAS